MKKLLLLLTLFLVFSMTACIGKDEKKYIDDFCSLEIDETLYIDGNYNHEVRDLGENDWDNKLDNSWWRIFYQITDLYPFVRNQEYNDYITVDFDQLVDDIEEAYASDGSVDFKSKLTLNYNQNIRNCSHEIEARYYDLFETYHREYGGFKHGYRFDVEPDGYYHIYYPTSSVTSNSYTGHITDPEVFKNGDIEVEVTSKYLGYDITMKENGNIIGKYHYSNYRYYQNVFQYTFNNDGDTMWYIYSTNSGFIRVTLDIDNPKTIMVTLSEGETTIYEEELVLNQLLTLNPNANSELAFRLLENDILEIVYDNNSIIEEKRILMTELDYELD